MGSFAMPVEEADPFQMAKLKLSEGKPLTSEEARLVAPVSMSEARLNRGMSGPEGPQKAPATKSALEGGQASSAQMAQGMARMQGIQPPQTQVTPFSKVNTGLQRAAVTGAPVTVPEAVDAITGASPMPALGKITTSPPKVAISQKAIPAVSAAGPPPVVSSAFQQAAAATGDPAIAQAADVKMNEPIPPEKAAMALDSFQKFMASNPDGLTLGNILDAVGVSLSAFGGTQRKTQLQENIGAQRQLSAQKALQEQGFGQQKDLQLSQQAQELLIKDKEIQAQQAQAKINLANAKDLNAQQAALDQINALAQIKADLDAKKQEIAAQTAASRSLLGPQAVAQAGGIQGLAKKWTSGVNE